MQQQLIVIGGGAAGFFCAVNAARLNPQLKVLLIEKSGKLLSKVKVSGGGRCNVTHACFDIEEISRRYPRGKNFVKKTFHQFFTTDTIEWFESRGVKLKAESDGRMFPITDSSQSIINCLLREAEKYKVQIALHTSVESIEKKDALFFVTLSDGKSIQADYVCIACGGYPKSAMFNWIKALGHKVEEPVPSLFTFNIPNHPITQLMGVSVDNTLIKISGTKLEQQGPLLITHWGLSGPAVLKLSAWGARLLSDINYHFSVIINWLPDYSESALREKLFEYRSNKPAQKVSGKSIFGLPQRLWLFLLSESGVSEDLLFAALPNKALNKLIQVLVNYTLQVKGKTTFKEEFVTAGGVELSEVEAHTLMSKKIDNLFFAGEILNIDGITGGYNFQNAWTTAFIAAKTISSSQID